MSSTVTQPAVPSSSSGSLPGTAPSQPCSTVHTTSRSNSNSSHWRWHPNTWYHLCSGAHHMQRSSRVPAGCHPHALGHDTSSPAHGVSVESESQTLGRKVTITTEQCGSGMSLAAAAANCLLALHQAAIRGHAPHILAQLFLKLHTSSGAPAVTPHAYPWHCSLLPPAPTPPSQPHRT